MYDAVEWVRETFGVAYTYWGMWSWCEREQLERNVPPSVSKAPQSSKGGEKGAPAGAMHLPDASHLYDCRSNGKKMWAAGATAAIDTRPTRGVESAGGSRGLSNDVRCRRVGARDVWGGIHLLGDVVLVRTRADRTKRSPQRAENPPEQQGEWKKGGSRRCDASGRCVAPVRLQIECFLKTRLHHEQLV